MKFLVATVLTALLGYTIVLFMPWWSMAITSLIVAVAVLQKPFMAFLAGFAGVFLLWSLHAWIISSSNDHLLAAKIGPVLQVGNSPYTVIIVTGVVGGLVSAFAAFTGSTATKFTKEVKS